MGDAKSWKAKLRSAAKEALVGERWTSGPGRGVFVSSPAWLEAPLQASWTVEVDSSSSGGAFVTGQGRLRCPEVCATLASMSPSAMVRDVQTPRFGDFVSAVNQLSLDLVSAGSLSDPGGNYVKWSVTKDGELEAALSGFTAMVRGPLRDWVDRRSTLGGFFELVTAGAVRVQSDSVRTVSVLAAQHDRVDVARGLLQGYAMPQLADDDDRIAEFERELQRLYPGYGELQRS